MNRCLLLGIIGSFPNSKSSNKPKHISQSCMVKRCQSKDGSLCLHDVHPVASMWQGSAQLPVRNRVEARKRRRQNQALFRFVPFSFTDKKQPGPKISSSLARCFKVCQRKRCRPSEVGLSDLFHFIAGAASVGFFKRELSIFTVGLSSTDVNVNGAAACSFVSSCHQSMTTNKERGILSTGRESLSRDDLLKGVILVNERSQKQKRRTQEKLPSSRIEPNFYQLYIQPDVKVIASQMPVINSNPLSGLGVNARLESPGSSGLLQPTMHIENTTLGP